MSLACHKQNIAPVGSAATVMRPDSSTSKGGMNTVPEAASISFAFVSTSSTVKYGIHIGGAPDSRWSARSSWIAQTSRPLMRAME
jgi:hypothetical protein